MPKTRTLREVKHALSDNRDFGAEVFPSEDDAPLPLEPLADQELSIAEVMGKPMLSELLGTLDGVQSLDDRIILMTTNDLGALDDAIIRPGRVDLLIKIDNLSNSTFFKMLDKFDIKYTQDQVDNFDVIAGTSPAMLQNDIRMDIDVLAKFNRNIS
jgi:SpoVK/Ycf46/Vps4 family AAA+-type ATPase